MLDRPDPVNGSQAAIAGMAWMIVSNGFSRFVGLASQIALGWLLTAQDFGLYAIALGLATVVGAIRNGGAMQLLLQRVDSYSAVFGPLVQYAFFSNLLAMCLLCILAPVAPYVFGGVDLVAMLVCIGLSYPVGTAAMAYRSQLTMERRFRELAILSGVSAAFSQGLLVGLAYMGWGPLSFAVALLLQPVCESILGWLYVKQLPSLVPRIGIATILDFLRETRWVMLTALMMSFATTGDYLVVGYITNQSVVGMYFFAFQLSVVVAVLFNQGIEAIFPSLFAQLRSDRTRLTSAFLKTQRTVALISFPIAFAFAYAVPKLMHFLWAGRWDGAANAAQVIALCIPAWLIGNVSRSLFEALGLWRARFVAMTCYGLGSVGAATLGALTGELDRIALYVTWFYVLYAAVILTIAGRVTRLPLEGSIVSVLGPAVLSIGSAAASLGFGELILQGADTWLKMLVVALTFLVILVQGNYMFFRDTWVEVFSTLVRGTHRRR